MSDLHVVFGAGQVGAPLVDALLARAHRVRVVRRSPTLPRAGVDAVQADASDRAACVRAATGADVVHHCLNAPYSTSAWAERLPTLQANLIEAAARADARLVVLDNLYMLGAPSGPIDEATPVRPCSRKGEIRARLSEALWSAHRAGTVRAVAGRASHLFGPGVEQSQIGAHLFSRVLSGRSAQVVGDPERLHSFAYAPDVAHGLAALSQAPETAFGRAHVLPAMPAMTTRAFHEALFAALGVSPRIDRVGPIAMRLVGLFVPALRESIEMRYEFDADYVVDDRAFRAAFGVSSTPLDEALRETARWVRTRFGEAATRRGVVDAGLA